MKARFIAVLILLVLIGLPILGYWYFFRANISSVQILVGSGVTAEISLRGALSYGWLPLADKALEYNKTCNEICEFSPILPTKYSLHISAENFANFSDNFSIKNGEKIIKNYSLVKTANYNAITIPEPLSADEKILRNEDIHAILWKDYSVIARDLSGNFWLTKNENQSTQIGIFSGNNFILKKNFPTGFQDISFDFYNNVMIFSHQNNEKILYSLDSDNVFDGKIPENTNKFSFWNNSWNAISDSQIFTEKNGNWSPNLRFSRFVDLGFWRAGFIDEKSENLLKIGNYNPEEWSVFVLMNRQNGEIYEIARALKITELFVHNNAIIFRDNNNFYSLKIPE